MMHFLGKFATALVLLASTVVAQANPSQAALAQIPTCTQKCGLDVLVPAQCLLTDLSSCLCTNSTLQLEFSVCVLHSCDLTDQFTSLTILQNDICKDVPIPSRSAEMIRAVIIISAFTYVIIVLRFYSRGLVMSKMWWDDWAIALAAILMIPMTIIPIFNATRGFGKHFWNVPPQNDLILRKLYYISQILYAVVQALAKFSILLLYLRIFPSKKFRLIVQIAIGWMICHTVALTMVVSLQCVPVKSVWDLTVDGVCIHSQAFVYSAAGISIFEDFVIMLLPIFELKDLSLNLKKKGALMFLFALGSFACITSMIRLKYIVAYGSSVDLSYDNVDVILWSVLEDYVAVICACLMCFRPLVVKVLPMIFSSPGLSESKHTQSQAWVQSRNSRLASKLGASVDRYELHSEDDEARGRPANGIMVQKAWATQTSEVASDAVELPERSYSMETYARSEDSRHGRRT